MQSAPTTRIMGMAVLVLGAIATASCAGGADQGSASGGNSGSGGASASGGGTASGGASGNSGGATGSGGRANSTGGSTATGGASTSTGGAPTSTGGAPVSTGGAPAATGGSMGNSGGAGGSSGGACDPFSNTGCAAGMKCSALQSGTTLTLGCGTKGTKTIGAACVPTLSGQMQTGDDCAEGLACFSATGESGATCHQMCTGNGAGTPACPSPMMCALKITGLNAVAFCQMTTSCSPLAQTPCTTTQGCYLTPSGAMCAPAGTKKPGDACTGANDCGRGSTCLLTNGVGKCAFFCSTAGGAPMCATTGTGGATCTAMSGTPAEPNLGTCN